MALSTQVRANATKKTAENDSKATPGAFTPARQLTRTPPPPTNIPTVGTPFTPPSAAATELTPATNATSPPLQNAMQLTTTQTAQEALDIALKHLTAAYGKVTSKLRQGQDKKKVTVEIPLPVFEEIGIKVTEAIHHLSQHKSTLEEIGDRFNHLEKSLKEAIAATAPKTYAQAAAMPVQEIVRREEIQQRNLERKAQQQRDRAKFEVILTAQDASTDVKQQLAEQSYQEITAQLQQAAEAQLEKTAPTIHGVQKLKSQDVRIHCNTAEEAERLRKLNWNSAYEGLTVRQPKYGIVIPGVPTGLISPDATGDPELIKQIEQQNKGSGLEIVEMRPLRRKLRGIPNDFSLLIFTRDPRKADLCLKHGLYINYQRFTAEKYTPQLQLTQCYRCQGFGHRAATCKSLHEICGKCSEHHRTAECHSETHKCTGCKGEHPAWHESCPNKINAIEKLKARKRQTQAYFNDK